jgi:hypothetical protein
MVITHTIATPTAIEMRSPRKLALCLTRFTNFTRHSITISAGTLVFRTQMSRRRGLHEARDRPESSLPKLRCLENEADGDGSLKSPPAQ